MRNIATILKEFLRVIVGLAIFSYGIHLMIAADIGVAPWDCLGQGIAGHSFLNYGMAMTFVSVCVLIIDLILRQSVGYGMIFDALLTGNMIQFYNDFCYGSNTLVKGILKLEGSFALFVSILMILAGMVFMSVGQVIYMGAGQTCGPRDTLLVGLGKLFPKIPIGFIQNSILIIVFLVGWMLGGSVGIGTVISVVVTGMVMEAVFRILKFDPRAVKHRSFLETTKMLTGGN